MGLASFSSFWPDVSVMHPKLFIRHKCEFEGENNGRKRNQDRLVNS
jgi:hypothetical protein